MFWLVVAAAALAGCRDSQFSRPPAVRWGEEACAHCRMIISDDRFAAALVDETGEPLKFDDIGCLIQHEAGRFRPGAAYWVCGFKAAGWLDARRAAFVHSTSIVSPMGYEVAASPEPDAAHDLAAGANGRVLSFTELPGLLAAERQTRQPTYRKQSDTFKENLR
jgi:copper chaperone NosL